MIPRIFGQRRLRPCVRPWRKRASAQRTSRRSASPTSVRPRSSGIGKPAGRSTMPSSGRIGAPRMSARSCGKPAMSARSRSAPGCCSIRISRRPRSPGCSTTSRVRATAARAGRLAFGTVDSFLLWRLTGGKLHATDATNAARTLLLDLRARRLGRGSLRAVRRAHGFAAAGARLRRRFRHDPAGLVRRPDPNSGHGRRPAGGDGGAGLLPAGHDEIDLRHRLLRPAQHRRRAGRLEQSAADHDRLSARRQAHLCARRRDFRRRSRGAMAARRTQAHRAGAGRECARRRSRSGRAGLSGAGFRRARRAVVGCRKRAARSSA